MSAKECRKGTNKQLSCCDGDVEGKRREDRPVDKEETAAPGRNRGCEVVNTTEGRVLQVVQRNKEP